MHSRDAKQTKRGSYPAKALSQAGRGFWSGVVMGLAAIPHLYSVDFNPPRYRSAGIAGDWRAVGNDIRGAMRRMEEC